MLVEQQETTFNNHVACKKYILDFKQIESRIMNMMCMLQHHVVLKRSLSATKNLQSYPYGWEGSNCFLRKTKTFLLYFCFPTFTPNNRNQKDSAFKKLRTEFLSISHSQRDCLLFSSQNNLTTSNWSNSKYEETICSSPEFLKKKQRDRENKYVMDIFLLMKQRHLLQTQQKMLLTFHL